MHGSTSISIPKLSVPQSPDHTMTRSPSYPRLTECAVNYSIEPKAIQLSSADDKISVLVDRLKSVYVSPFASKKAKSPCCQDDLYRSVSTVPTSAREFEQSHQLKCALVEPIKAKNLRRHVEYAPHEEEKQNIVHKYDSHFRTNSFSTPCTIPKQGSRSVVQVSYSVASQNRLISSSHSGIKQSSHQPKVIRIQRLEAIESTPSIQHQHCYIANRPDINYIRYPVEFDAKQASDNSTIEQKSYTPRMDTMEHLPQFKNKNEQNVYMIRPWSAPLPFKYVSDIKPKTLDNIPLLDSRSKLGWSSDNDYTGNTLMYRATRTQHNSNFLGTFDIVSPLRLKNQHHFQSTYSKSASLQSNDSHLLHLMYKDHNQSQMTIPEHEFIEECLEETIGADDDTLEVTEIIEESPTPIDANPYHIEYPAYTPCQSSPTRHSVSEYQAGDDDDDYNNDADDDENHSTHTSSDISSVYTFHWD